VFCVLYVAVLAIPQVADFDHQKRLCFDHHKPLFFGHHKRKSYVPPHEIGNALLMTLLWLVEAKAWRGAAVVAISADSTVTRQSVHLDTLA
jgi:hypothetical protein